ncbi:PREDICTED: cytochrome P450 2K1-like [Nanorana parkeri]|uniref:cytochrome P450 2K1-like n=1 Tax=Nanorana parkeri TaxID=125878 RepID=UPI000854326F|nr:PREDICTED: cytochrome P450 2K1-like [Nanorana parkeri]
MYLTDPVTIILSIVTCTFLAIVLYGKKKKVHPNFPPGPPALPIIGNMHMINIKKPHLTFHELAKKYGSVYSLQIGPQKIVVLSGYEAVKDALVNHAEVFVDRPHVPFFKDLTKGNGILFSNGDNWKAMRRFTHSALRDLGTRSTTIEDKISEECRHLADTFKAYKGRPFENTSILYAAVANIIISIVLGHRFNYDDPKFCRLLAINNEIIRIIGCLMVQLYNAFPSLIRWFPGSHKQAHQILYEMHAFIRETFTNQNNKLDVYDQRSLIDFFLVKQKEEKPNPNLHFTDANLAFLVSDLFGAGMESTATALRWGLLLIMKYPEIQRNVQNEIEKVIGSGEARLMHRKDMPYTDAVIHEILRFGNIAPTGVPHSTSQDVTLKGFFIPKGTQVIALLYSVLKDKDHFEKPEEFYPQHFLDSNGNFVKNEAFMAFSAGKRSCAGETLAKMELFLFFTTLLQNFTFQAPPGAKLDLTGDVGFSTPPLKHEICAIPRN